VSFYERREIKDVLAYLRLIANPRDEVSLKRIINLPPRGIGSTTIKKLETYARKKEISMFETLQYHLSDIPSLSPSGKKAIENFTQLIKKYQQKAAQPGVKRMIEEILEEIRYFKMLEKEPPEEAQVRAENLEELISSAAAFENLHPQATLVQYLEEIALLTQIDQWSKEKEMVNLMTLHNAKGLEFRICFIVGLEENIFPHQLSLISSEEIEEERRLCYVGMTRAQEKLYLTAAKNRLLRGQPCYNEISRFIREIKDELEEIEPSKTIKHSSLYLPQADNFYD
jgi:DNA helicase-2/ATP-dependent DNA helicase PcrA